MKAYLDIVSQVLERGEKVPTRTGIDCVSVLGVMFKHDMAKGFPLLTTKKVHFHSVKAELEFFIKGKTSKRWLHGQNCHIWDEWANPQKIPANLSTEERLQKQKDEDDLGPIYGKQWRNFSAPNDKGVDQLKHIVNEIKTNPNSRKLIVSAWNPLEIKSMALEPCHVLFNVNIRGKKLNLTWYQRSCDLMLGIPFNIASYALLLHLLAKECNMEEGQLTGMLNDVHIYENHTEGAKLQLEQPPERLPNIATNEFTSIFNWEHYQTKVHNYEPKKAIKFKIAV